MNPKTLLVAGVSAMLASASRAMGGVPFNPLQAKPVKGQKIRIPHRPSGVARIKRAAAKRRRQRGQR